MVGRNKTDTDRARDLITESRKVDACTILVNLACAEQNKVYMAQEHKNLLDDVIHGAYYEKSLQARELTSMVSYVHKFSMWKIVIW